MTALYWFNVCLVMDPGYKVRGLQRSLKKIKKNSWHDKTSCVWTVESCGRAKISALNLTGPVWSFHIEKGFFLLSGSHLHTSWCRLVYYFRMQQPLIVLLFSFSKWVWGSKHIYKPISTSCNEEDRGCLLFRKQRRSPNKRDSFRNLNQIGTSFFVSR